MFGEQAAQARGLLIQSGMPAEQVDALMQYVGNCQSSLRHRGSVEFNGPLTATGDTTIRGPLEIGDEKSPSWANLTINVPIEVDSALSFGPNGSITLPDDRESYPTSFIRGVLDEDLIHDGTAILIVGVAPDEEEIEVDGYFVRDGYKVPAGKRVGAFLDMTDEVWYAVVTEECTVVV
jgi:hypothetical protein